MSVLVDQGHSEESIWLEFSKPVLWNRAALMAAKGMPCNKLGRLK